MLEFDSAEATLLCEQLARMLVRERSLNEFLELALPHVARAFRASRVALVDYYEQTDRLALLHFEGFGDDIYLVQEQLDEVELRRALQSKDPFHPRGQETRLVVPLRFSDILEALLFLEADHPLTLGETELECGLVASRILGLLMSSSRLAVNRRFSFETSDLRRAREIQLSFLPSEYPKQERFEVFGLNRSSAMVGGDYLDYFVHRDESVQTILADACGHGLAAALIMSNFRGLLKAQLSAHRDYAGLFNRLNESVHFEADFIQYLTGVFLDLNQQTGELRYLNAGHFDPLVVTPSGGSRKLSGGGPPLGMFKGSRYGLLETHISRGDIIALFTDGLVEIENNQSQQFGEERILETIRQSVHRPLPEIANQVLKQATDFAGAGEAEDDVTLLLLKLN